MLRWAVVTWADRGRKGDETEEGRSKRAKTRLRTQAIHGGGVTGQLELLDAHVPLQGQDWHLVAVLSLLARICERGLRSHLPG